MGLVMQHQRPGPERTDLQHMTAVQLLIVDRKTTERPVREMKGWRLTGVGQWRGQIGEPIAQLADSQVVVAMPGFNGLSFDWRKARTLRAVQRGTVANYRPVAAQAVRRANDGLAIARPANSPPATR